MSPQRHTWIKKLAVAAAVIVALGAAAYVAAERTAPPVDAHESGDPIHVVEDETLLYTFDAVSGEEGLFDRGADPQLRRNLAPARVPDVERLRKRLLARERAETLQKVRERHQETVARLRALGYM